MNYKFDVAQLPTDMPIGLDNSAITTNGHMIPHFRGLNKVLADGRYDFFITEGVLKEFGDRMSNIKEDYVRDVRKRGVYNLMVEVYERLGELVVPKPSLPVKLKSRIRAFFMATNKNEIHPVDVRLIDAVIGRGLMSGQKVAVCSLDEGLKTAFCTTVRHLDSERGLFYVNHDDQFPLAEEHYHFQRKSILDL